MTRRALIAVALLAFGNLSPAQPKPESVCEILGHLENFSGRIVTIRARVDAGLWLEAEDCPVKIRVGAFVFENRLAVYWPASLVEERSRLTVPFPTDEAARRWLWRALDARHGINPRLYVTLEGLIVTRDPPLALVLKNNPKVRLGFGPTGLALAAIIVKGISEIDLSRESEDGTRESIPVAPAQKVR